MTHAGDSAAGCGMIQEVIASPEIAMAAPVPLRSDFDAPRVRTLAKGSRDPDQTRRLLALAAIYDGATRTRQRGSAASRCRSCATGYCASTLRGRKDS